MSVKTPKSIIYAVIPLVIIFNVALIVIGVFSFTGGLTEIAITLWVITAITDVFLIIGISYLIKFHKKVQPKIPALPNPSCVIFIAVIVAAILLMSIMNIII